MSVVARGKTFEEFVRQFEPRLRLSLVAMYGAERGREAAAEALACAWELPQEAVSWRRLCGDGPCHGVPDVCCGTVPCYRKIVVETRRQLLPDVEDPLPERMGIGGCPVQSALGCGALHRAIGSLPAVEPTNASVTERRESVTSGGHPQALRVEGPSWTPTRRTR